MEVRGTIQTNLLPETKEPDGEVKEKCNGGKHGARFRSGSGEWSCMLCKTVLEER